MRTTGWCGLGSAGRGLSAIRPAALVLALLWGGPAAAADAIGSVSALVGEAQATGRGETRPRPLAVGTKVFEGDRIHTAADAKLRLQLADDSVLTLGAATDLDLSRFQYAPAQAARHVLLEVPRGILRVLVQLLVANSVFEVQSSTAVASVRGTEWIAEAQPDATAIVALAGRVAVRNADPAQAGEVVLLPGEGTTVPAGAPPQAVKTWGAARKDAFIARTSLP